MMLGLTRIRGKDIIIVIVSLSCMACFIVWSIPGVRPYLGFLPVMDISNLQKPRVMYPADPLTVVTAYFDLGKFKKGKSLYFSTDTYFDWASSFQYLANPLVVYSDSKRFISRMRIIRKDFQNITKIIYTDRNLFWSFQIIEEIRNIYQKPGYPKFHPNTVVPGYSCAQHSKIAVVADAIRQDYFQAKHHAWLDVGYFRDIVDQKNKFTLKMPPNFNPKRVAMNEALPKPTPEPTMDNIFLQNMAWIGGGFFFGRREVLLKFEEQYRRTVMYFLNRGLMNTDQQILYALFSRDGRRKFKPKVDVQLFTPSGTGNGWFYLSFLCYIELTNE